VLLACFGDPGLAALREISPVPVVGLLESALSEAARRDRRFATLTAGPVWVAMLDEMIRLSPYSTQNRGVFAIDATGLSVSRDPDGFVGSLQLTLENAISSGAEAVLLGGSALAGFGPRLAGGSVELIDPLRSAMRALQDHRGSAFTHHPIAPPRLASRGLNLPLSRGLAGDTTATGSR
jgi:Asp/Glu/hydantoin racemase